MYLNENIKLKKYPRFHREPIMPRVGRDMKDWLIFFFFIYIYVSIYMKQHWIKSTNSTCWHQHYIFFLNHNLIVDLFVRIKCARALFMNRVPADDFILLCGGLRCPRDPDRRPSCVNFSSALLKLVTDWSLVLCERSLRERRMGFLFFILFCCICTV